MSYLLAFAVDQGKLEVIILNGFICPVQWREDMLMGFWFMADSGHVPWRYTASTSPHRPCCWGDWCWKKASVRGKKQGKGEKNPRHREQNRALAYLSLLFSHWFRLPNDKEWDVYRCLLDECWFSVQLQLYVCLYAWLHICIWKPGCKATEWCKAIHVYIPSLPEHCLNFPD